MSGVRVVLIRHGETEWNKHQQQFESTVDAGSGNQEKNKDSRQHHDHHCAIPFAGDPLLSANGRSQAQALGIRLAGREFASAMSTTSEPMSSSSDSSNLVIFACSPSRRAKQTAAAIYRALDPFAEPGAAGPNAASEDHYVRTVENVAFTREGSSDCQFRAFQDARHIYELSAFRELSYGSWDGSELTEDVWHSVKELRQRWADGDVDACAPGAADSPSTIATAACEQLATLVRAAHSLQPSHSTLPPAVLVVSHGRTLKALLALLLKGNCKHMDEFDVKNGSVNVLDIDALTNAATLVAF